MLENLGIAILLVGLVVLLVHYARTTKDAEKKVVIVNPWTVSLLVIVSILLIFDLFK